MLHNFGKKQSILGILGTITALYANRDGHSEIYTVFTELNSENVTQRITIRELQKNKFRELQRITEIYIQRIIENYIQRINSE